jgi:hypothetical protein
LANPLCFSRTLISQAYQRESFVAGIESKFGWLVFRHERFGSYDDSSTISG